MTLSEVMMIDCLNQSFFLSINHINSVFCILIIYNFNNRKIISFIKFKTYNNLCYSNVNFCDINPNFLRFVIC